MDPALWELLTAEEAEADREVEAIIRLRDVDQAVPGVRLVARFGRIATCRVRSASIVDVRSHPNVFSLKAPRKLDADHAGAPPADVDMSIRRDLRPTDSRRPRQDALTGAGVVVGVVDWGFDFDHPNFKYPDGTTRLLALWDQRDIASGNPPQPYGYGAVYSRNQINRAVRTAQPYISLGYHPGSADRGGGAHGTHVADVAAGSGSAGSPRGVAPDAHLVFVHLADRNTGGLANLGDSVRLLEAVDFIARVAEPRPWVINMSIGRHGGPHDGTTLAELAFDELLRAAPGRFIVQSTGNYYLSRTHASGRLTRGQAHTLTFVTSPADITENELEIWYDGDDEFVVHIQPPGTPAAISVPLRHHARLTAGDQVVGRIYHRAGDPNNNDNHIDAFLHPQGRAGRWTVTLEPVRLVNGQFDAWLERAEACKQCQARFTSADSDPTSTTGTIANSQLPLVVGAYDGHSPAREVAAFSSSGPTRDARIKPDLVAPGVDVLAARSAPPGSPRSSGQLVRKSGSSMAAPHVTGAVALCLQAGGDRLRAEQLRALLLATAQPALTTEDARRLGRGYLDLAALVTDALRRFPRQIPHDRTQGTTMDTELDPIARLALAPSRAYRELMYRPHGATAQWIADRFDIVARPGQQITDRPRQGDVLLRVSLGHPNAGVCAVIDQPDNGQRRMAPGQLLLRRRAIREGPPPIEHDFGDEADAETRTPVVVDTAAAVPAFEMTERSRIAEPLLTPRESASAVEWTSRVHPAISGVTVDEIRAALASYTDASAVQSAIQARNQQDPAQAVDASSPTTDAVFVECVHQFQMKCYLESREHDGRAGESTLDSLGLIARQGSGLRTADRGNATAQQRLNSRDTEVRKASARAFSAANWFTLMTDPSVFGLRTKGGRGLHVALVRKLRQAERHLITLPAFRGMTPAALGRALGLSEKHGGARPTATTTSVHTFGLAIDIAYQRNPWVRRAASWRAMRRAASLISGVNLTHASAPAYFSSLGSDPSRSTGEIWDEIQQRNAELIAYLGFAADPQALRAALTAGQARGTPGLINQGESLHAAVVRWQRDIDQDRRALTTGDFNGRRPERGLLTHPRDLAIAIRDHGCLAWGAVDLGPGDRGSGDMMHYDARIDGVGRVLTEGTRAFLPTAGHPCLSLASTGVAEEAAFDAVTLPAHVKSGLVTEAAFKKASIPTSWGGFGEELRRTEFMSEGEGAARAITLLKKSSTFNRNATRVGAKYRSQTKDMDAWVRADANYKGKRFLQIIGSVGAGGAFVTNVSPFLDSIQIAIVNQADMPLVHTQQLAHEVSHVLSFLSRPGQPKDLWGAIQATIDNDEVKARLIERKILNEIRKADRNAPAFRTGSTDPRTIEREISGTMLTYLEQAVLYFNLDKAAAAESLSPREAWDLQETVEVAFPAEPTGQSQYARTFFKILKAKDGWRRFHERFSPESPNYILERDRLANEHAQTVLSLQAMYRS